MKNLFRHRRPDTERGISLTELMITTMLLSTVFAIAVPAGKTALDSLELGNAAQQMGFALQTARLRAVSANRPMRLRLNCPGTGQYRVVEVTGVVATDSDANRCDGSTFGYPGPRDSDPATPTHDGPVRFLSSKIDGLSGPDLEFGPDGTTRTVSGNTPSTIATDAIVEVTRLGVIRQISINALGRIKHVN